MDPNAALYDLVEALKEVIEHAEDNTNDREGFMDALENLSEQAKDLRSWINRGGFLPNKKPANAGE